MSAFGHDCLYYDPDNTLDYYKSLIPFCLRPETVKQSNDEDKLCYGKNITFKELKTKNVRSSDLFYWNAVIEIIDLYEKYLILPNLVDENEFYCNCSLLSRFGKSCQYDSDAISSQIGFSFSLSNSKSVSSHGEVENENFTCYIGIQCQTNLFCLDWRQICNGIVDCDHGEDEPFELCLQMELNECHPEKEFRCKNGLCIPISIMSSITEACLDRGDGRGIFNTVSPNYLTELCFNYPSYECDETNHGWKQFSCHNGQYISYSDLTSKTSKRGKTCANNRHLMYLQRLFSVTNEDECWKLMICLTGFDYLYSNMNCSNETIETNIERYCPNEYYFPLNSVVYSFVFFLYNKMNRPNWLNYTGPNYICYKKEYCQNNILISSTITKNNLTCFLVNQTIFSWINFYEYIIYLFNSCYLKNEIHVNNKMFCGTHIFYEGK